MRLSIRIHALSTPHRVLAFALTLFLGLVAASCGETYRPVAQPIIGLQPSPAPSHTVVSINSDGVGDNHRDRGSATSINVSGDSVEGNLKAGMAPVHAALLAGGSRLYIANSGEDTVSVSNASDPTAVAATVSLPPSPSATITLCSGDGSTATYTYAGSQQFFVGDEVYVTGCATNGLNGAYTVTAASAGSFSVANTTTATDTSEPVGTQAKVPNAVFANTAGSSAMYVAGYGTNLLYVINATTDALTASVPVDIHPVAVAEAPGVQKVYVANRGIASAGSVSVIDTVSNTVSKTICLSGGGPPPCAGGPIPVWAVARADSARVYVLDKNGTIYAIDTSMDTVIDASHSAGAGANFMFFDKTFNRLYVTNPSLATLSVFDVSGSAPATFGIPITISAAAGSPCLATAVTPITPTSVTVLGDGSRAYVSSYQLSPGAVCTQLSVIDSLSGTLSKTIPLGQFSDTSAQTGCGTAGFRVFTASSSGGTNSSFKVYVSQCDAGTIAVVDTYPADGSPEDTYGGVSLSAPLSTFPALSSGYPPAQNPVFMVPGQ